MKRRGRRGLAEISTLLRESFNMPAFFAMVVSLVGQPVARPGVIEPPLIDLREQLPWKQRLPARLGTGALWMGSLSLLGPLKLMAVLLIGGLLAPWVLRLDRGEPRQRRDDRAPRSLTAAEPPPVSRSTLAAHLGLPESQLFRARHGAICTVHHDAEGRIVAIDLPLPPPAQLFAPHDAHPVG
ncbi:MAG: PgaD-like protein [Cyanobacteriota bacterium]|jgi:hypothetical protein